MEGYPDCADCKGSGIAPMHAPDFVEIVDTACVKCAKRRTGISFTVDMARDMQQMKRQQQADAQIRAHLQKAGGQ